MTDETLNREFQHLCDAVFDNTATAEQRLRLESLVLASKELRSRYVKLSQFHASLWLLCENYRNLEEAASFPWHDATVAMSGNDSRTAASPVNAHDLIGGSRPRLKHWLLFALIAAALLFAVTLLWSWNRNTARFALMVCQKNVRWESASISTESGERIGVAHLRLAEGLVTIQFDCGARVDLEGPSDLEILSKWRCRLNSGKLVTTLGNGLKGFVVETPRGTLIDQGTSFGVSVRADGISDVQVFEGRVDIAHKKTGERRSLAESQGARLHESGIQDLLQAETIEALSASDSLGTANFVQISTSLGSGQDHWIQRNELKRKGSNHWLLAKRERAEFDDFDRKIYLCFDLSSVEVARVTKASFQMTATPTGMGFSSRMPDATFAIYGITDESLDQWVPSMLTWDSAPAHAKLANQVNLAQATYLGEFTIPRGQKAGEFAVENDRLKEFLLLDTNSLVTLIVVCETQSIQDGSLVHGFASSRHESLPPPTLRLWLDRLEE